MTAAAVFPVVPSTWRQVQRGKSLLARYEALGGERRLPPQMRPHYRQAAAVVRQYDAMLAGGGGVGFLPFILGAAVLALVGYGTFFVIKTGEELRPAIVEGVGEAAKVVAQGTAWVSVAALAGGALLFLNSRQRRR